MQQRARHCIAVQNVAVLECEVLWCDVLWCSLRLVLVLCTKH